MNDCACPGLWTLISTCPDFPTKIVQYTWPKIRQAICFDSQNNHKEQKITLALHGLPYSQKVQIWFQLPKLCLVFWQGAIGKWVVEQQASMGQMLQENLPVAAEWTESQINALVEMYNLTQASSLAILIMRHLIFFRSANLIKRSITPIYRPFCLRRDVFKRVTYILTLRWDLHHLKLYMVGKTILWRGRWRFLHWLKGYPSSKAWYKRKLQVRDDMKALYTSVMPTKVCTEEQRRQFLVALARAKVNAQKASNAHDEISQRVQFLCSLTKPKLWLISAKLCSVFRRYFNIV